MSNFILVAETGSDIPAELAKEKNIFLVPMHVSMGDRFLDDGTFPPQEVCDYFDRTGKLPTTSGSTPGDFTKVFDEIHAQYPDKKILYLAYSSVTTCSYHSAMLAAEDRDYIVSMDTKHVSVGHGAIVLQMADYLEKNPNATLEQAVAKAEDLCSRARMCFLPDDLEYLRAGGRVSNAVCLVGRFLGIHPRIEILDGRLVGTKKHRGKMEKLVPELLRNFTLEQSLSRTHLWLIRTVGLPENICKLAEKMAAELKYKSIQWIQPASVITTHGGPRAFGVVGFTES